MFVASSEGCCGVSRISLRLTFLAFGNTGIEERSDDQALYRCRVRLCEIGTIRVRFL